MLANITNLMMKFKLILLTALILGLSNAKLKAQSACSKYGGDYNQILTALKSKNTSTDRHKLDEGHLKSIATYWVAACKCEKGVTTEAEAQQLYTTIFDNRLYITDNFTDRGKVIYKDKTPFGDLYPGEKLYTKSNCLAGKYTSAITMESTMGCNDEAKDFFNTASDQQQYGKAFFRAYCECKKGVTNSERQQQLAVDMKENLDNYHDHKAPSDPRIVTEALLAKECPFIHNNWGKSANQKTATQIEIENRFKNYNTAMNLKGQGEAIAKAFAEQVKQFGKMGYAANPQAQLDNFNHNMQQIAQMQSQNKTDNLNQLDNTVGTALNQLNSGNGEGAMLSTLSLIDQRYEQKQAQKEAEKQKAQLIAQQKDKMSQFYWKAVELNNNALNKYLQIAAYSFSKTDEDFNISYANHHRCFDNYMKKNYSYTNIKWTQNNCRKPVKTTQIENNLISKDVQYINAAKRKFNWFEKDKNEDFREGAIRFAGAAATEKPKAEYYYLMGHYAGIDNPIVAYTSFEAARSLSSKYFSSTKSAEYEMVSQALQASFKKAIESNNQEIIKEIIASQLHNAVKIDDQPAIIYAIKVDQPDVVQLFLNDYADGKSQSIINTKIQEVIMMAAVLDAPKTIQRFVDLGFSVDFELNGNNPVMVADEAIALDALEVLLTISEKKELYLSELKRTNSEFLIYKDILNNADNNNLISIKEKFSKLKTAVVKGKVAIALLKQEKRETFFMLLELDNSLRKEIRQQKYEETIVNFFLNDIVDLRQQSVWKYVDYHLIPLNNHGELTLDYAVKLIQVHIKKQNLKNGITGSTSWSNLVGLSAKRSNILIHLDCCGEHGMSDLNYAISILYYAMWVRKDPKLAEVLLENYTQLDYNWLRKTFVKNIFTKTFYWPSQHPYLSDKSEQEINKGIRELQIINLLLDNQETKSFLTNDDFKAISLLCINRFSSNIIISEKAYILGKETVDRMIEAGFSSDLLYYAKSKEIKKYVNRPWEKEDSRYWKAVFSGDYENRYK